MQDITVKLDMNKFIKDLREADVDFYKHSKNITVTSQNIDVDLSNAKMSQASNSQETNLSNTKMPRIADYQEENNSGDYMSYEEIEKLSEEFYDDHGLTEEYYSRTMRNNNGNNNNDSSNNVIVDDDFIIGGTQQTNSTLQNNANNFHLEEDRNIGDDLFLNDKDLQKSNLDNNKTKTNNLGIEIFFEDNMLDDDDDTFMLGEE